ncbi:MAG: acyl-CoA dehydrogenase, partial [Planctomycetaceae bacterium]|nr:acyl-CoA dehydrogenase [Planctomycetaceae bacterium]
KYAAIELYMKTHGGRAFLHGHLFGDNVHEFLAPSIYEGEGEMLSMAFFKSLVKEHGREFFEPIGRILFDAGIRSPRLTNPRHLWLLRKPMLAYATWYAGRRIAGASRGNFDNLPTDLRRHAEFATSFLAGSAMDVSGVMRRHQLKLADRQCAMSLLSARLQDAVTILVTSLYAGRQTDSLTQAAADCVCRDLRRKMVGGLPTERDFRITTELGQAISETEWSSMFGVAADPIMMSYPQ